jgi:hypothetical protein
MARHGQFNKSKRRYKNISSRKRNCKGSSFVNCDDPEPKERIKFTSSGLTGHPFFSDQALQFMETRTCTYCCRNLEDDDCNIDDLCNQLCCESCLFCPARSESWWGSATDLALEEEDCFDIDSGAADNTLHEEVPWHVMVSAIKSNQKLVPSTGGSKRKYYSMVTTHWEH